MLDYLPFLMLAGYLLGQVRPPRAVGSLASLERAGHEDAVPGTTAGLAIWVAARVAAAMLLGHAIAPTSMTMAVAGLGAVVAVYMPLAPLSTSKTAAGSRFPLVASATSFAILMPTASAAGLLVFAVVFWLTRKPISSAVGALLIVPPVAWLMNGSDIFLLFGSGVLLLLLYRYLDRVETQVRASLGLAVRTPVFRRVARRAAVVVGLAALLTLVFLGRYVYHGFGLHPEIFRWGDPQLKYIAITFDDGPDPNYTPAILDTLKEREVEATFFVVGRHVDQYPEIVRRMLEEGHEVASHTYNHRNLLQADEATVIRELELTEAALDRAAGFTPKLFRPPRGLYSRETIEAAHERGYTVALWSLSSVDWLGTSPQRIVRVMAEKTRPGDILLFHDSGDFISSKGGHRHNTVQSIGPLIDRLRAQGYEFVTVSDLMVLTLINEGEEQGD